MPQRVPLLSWLLAVAFLAQACGGTQNVRRTALEDLAADEGLVVFRLLSTEMARDPGAIWGQGFRLHYRPLDAGPMDAVTSSMKLRGRYVEVEAGGGSQLHVLRLSGGKYTFYSVVSSLQEKPMDVRFDVANGQMTYVGDVQLDLVTRLSEFSGTSKVESVGAKVLWSPDGVREELERRYPGGVPELGLRQATVLAR